jgi:hypothetical protein
VRKLFEYEELNETQQLRVENIALIREISLSAVMLVINDYLEDQVEELSLDDVDAALRFLRTTAACQDPVARKNILRMNGKRDCKICKWPVLLTDFPRFKLAKDGYGAICKKCKAARS